MRKYLFIGQSVSQLKEEIQNKKFKQFNMLANQCERYFEVELPEVHPEKSTTFMGMAIANLSLIYLLTDQKIYLKEALRWIKAVVGYEKWGNAHLVNVDLSASWIMFGLSLSYDWLKDHLDQEDKQAIEKKLILQADIMYQYAVETKGRGWSTNYFQNHNWINYTGLAAAGYALKGIADDSNIWIQAASENFRQVYPYLPEDGSSYEGIVYWRYGAMWLFVYAYLLRDQGGRDYFKETPFLKETFYYRLYHAVPNLEETAYFGDAHDTRSAHSSALYYLIADVYNNPYAQNLGHLVEDEFIFREHFESKIKPGILPEAWLNLLWYNPDIETKDFSDLPTIRFFDDIGILSYRSSWKPDATFFCIKASYPGGKKQWARIQELDKLNIDALSLSHQHPDNLSFILYGRGEYLTVDDGYNRNMKVGYHSSLTLDGYGYEVEDVNDVFRSSIRKLKKDEKDFKEENYHPEIKALTFDNNSFIFSADSHEYYARSTKALKVQRTVLAIDHDYFILIDELESEIPHHFKLLFQTSRPAQEMKDGFKYLYEFGQLKVVQINKVTHDFKLHHIKAVMTTQEPFNFHEKDLFTLRFCYEKPRKEVLYVTGLFVDDIYENQHKVQSLTNSAYHIMKINHQDYNDIVIVRKLNDYQYLNIASDAKALILSYQKGILKKIVFHEGTYLVVDGIQIVKSSSITNIIKEIN